MKMLVPTYEALIRIPSKREYVKAMIDNKLIELINFVQSEETTKSFLTIHNNLRDECESFYLVTVTLNRNIIATSNLENDITYLKKNKIIYYTIWDFIEKAKYTNKLSEVKTELFLKNIESAKLKIYDYKTLVL